MSGAPPVVLSIAGSDSGGGAGIQADLKTFAALGVFGTTAISAVTAQNTRGVQAVHPVPSGMVAAQIDSVLGDFRVRAIKTGMLATADIIDVVAGHAAAGRLPNLVVDPVMVATSGDRLLDRAAERSYIEGLFRYALVVTPNIAEASVLLGWPVHDLAGAERAACELAALGPSYVVVKGGHLGGSEAVDVVAHDGAVLRHLRAPRVATANVHGTGCTFSAATAALLAHNVALVAALEGAKAYLTGALEAAARWRLGAGAGPVDHAFAAGRSDHVERRA